MASADDLQERRTQNKNSRGDLPNVADLSSHTRSSSRITELLSSGGRAPRIASLLAVSWL